MVWATLGSCTWWYTDKLLVRTVSVRETAREVAANRIPRALRKRCVFSNIQLRVLVQGLSHVLMEFDARSVTDCEVHNVMRWNLLAHDGTVLAVNAVGIVFLQLSFVL